MPGVWRLGGVHVPDWLVLVLALVAQMVKQVSFEEASR